MDMKNSLQKSFLKELTDYNFKLPNIKSIEISKIGIYDTNVKDFLQHLIPCKLANLFIEKQFNEYDPYADFLISPICNALLKVNKQVCLREFNFKEKQLEQIIISSFNCKILIFDTCAIRYSDYLDFNVSKKYKIKYLLFKNCGKKNGNVYSYWVGAPSKFIYIIEAISKTQLKSSLQKVGIYNCSLNIILVQKWFDEFGMSHVEVVG